jgi:hypothetical protein
MADSGQAMTSNHPVWNEADLQAGRAALARFEPTPEARAQRIADPRERAWFSAVEILRNGAGSKPERGARYATAMEQLSRAYPKDNEAQLFYALALLGKSEGVKTVYYRVLMAPMIEAVKTLKRETDALMAAVALLYVGLAVLFFMHLRQVRIS